MNIIKLVFCVAGAFVGALAYQAGEQIGRIKYQQDFMGLMEKAAKAQSDLFVKNEETEE